MAQMHRATALGRLAQINGMLDDILEKCQEANADSTKDCILQMKAYNHMLIMRLQKMKTPERRHVPRP